MSKRLNVLLTVLVIVGFSLLMGWGPRPQIFLLSLLCIAIISCAFYKGIKGKVIATMILGVLLILGGFFTPLVTWIKELF